MNLSFQTSLFLVLFCIVAAIGISIFLYRYTVPPVSRRRKNILIALRSAALTFLLLAICEPLLQLISTTVEEPVVALLVDNSLSMTQTDARGNRESIVRSILSSSALKQFSSKAKMQLWSFNQKAQEIKAESLSMNGSSTNIAGAIQTVAKNSSSPPFAILLVTDGNYNTGSNPLYEAEHSKIPFYVVGVGDTVEQKDVSVSKLIVNNIAYVETSLPVDGSIKVSGILPTTFTVSLLEDGKIISQQQVRGGSTDDAVNEFPFQFSYTPKSVGIKKISVSIASVNGEITAKNNVRSALIKVLKNKMSIVIIAGAPSADVSTIMATLKNDVNNETFLFLQRGNGEIYSPSEQFTIQQKLSGADCVMLIGFPSASTSVSTLQSISTTIREKNIPLLFIASRTLDLSKTRQMESILPFTIASEKMDEQSVFASINQQYKYHQLVRLSTAQQGIWEKLPPVYYSLPTFKAKPEAIILSGISLQNVTLQQPLIVLRNAAGIRSLAILGYGINRWNLLAAGTDDTKGFFSLWFSAMTRWLATRDHDKRLHVEPEKEFYAQGEEVMFEGQAYNESFEPIDGAEIVLRVHSLGEKTESVEQTMFGIGTGRYTVSIGNLSEGDYRYSALLKIGGAIIDSTQGRFSIGEQQLEFAETKMNKPLLQQLASASGGTYADASQFEHLLNTIQSNPQFKPQEKINHTEFELWNLPMYLSLIIFFFAVEWFLRKRSGML